MKLLRNKRGAAMESAILFMLVVLMLGMLLTGVIMSTHLRVKLNDTMLTREITIEQIGEDFVAGKDLTQIDDYSVSITEADGNRILTLKNKSETKVLLYVEIPQNSNTPTVWKYTE